MDRRSFIKNTSLLSLTAALHSGLNLRADTEKYFDETVKIGYLPITDANALLIAHQIGLFKEEGLKSDKPTLMRGWSPLVEAFTAKKFNVVHLLKPIPIWMKFANNIPVKIPACAHTNGSALVVGNHKNVTSVKDLGGSNLAVPYWYSMHNIILQKLLKENGLTSVIQDKEIPLKPNEVNLQILPPPEMPLALVAKKIDGYIVAEPFNSFGELKANATVLRFTGDIWKNHPCCVVTMHEDVLNQQQEWSQKVINAIVKAGLFISENRVETAKILSNEKSGLLPFDFKVVDRAMNFYDNPVYAQIGANRNKDIWKNNRIDFDPYPYPTATEFIIEAMKDTLVEGNLKFLDNIDPKKAVNEIIDYRYVTNAVNKFYKTPSTFSREEKFDF
ncbi:nitrate/sulfonate/bicarbonate ABC transporter, periplasmic substrate-binding protein [Aliarcobacter cibarius]|uniref:Nitrate/sulfonate/bicarbonate ABC transporter, periplasmic substrate-binding protein n=1 Tax=Aliarcobacter cibarius TaxID=255507 RepID=A0A7L5JM31_9BACT|nr:ABC transporter substrate-binding protein [Aliarcobacter cibarius]QKJ26216.1 nitrate/sulfonate/bicarbonate ABC transporter, periplasmic substrate-binding protein [Aliarcobacter cibarius]